MRCRVTAAETIPELEFRNVRDRSLGEIWSASPAFAKFHGTEWMVDPCRSCPRQEIDLEDAGVGRWRSRAIPATPILSATLSPFHGSIEEIVLAETERRGLTISIVPPPG